MEKMGVFVGSYDSEVLKRLANIYRLEEGWLVVAEVNEALPVIRENKPSILELAGGLIEGCVAELVQISIEEELASEARVRLHDCRADEDNGENNTNTNNMLMLRESLLWGSLPGLRNNPRIKVIK